MTADRRSLLWRLGAVLAAALFAFGQSGSVWHYVLVAHEVCAEHGVLAHGDGHGLTHGDGHGALAHGDENGHASDDDGEVAHEHAHASDGEVAPSHGHETAGAHATPVDVHPHDEHCASDCGLVAARSIASPSSDSALVPSGSSRFRAHALRLAGAAIHTYAPKTSPPA